MKAAIRSVFRRAGLDIRRVGPGSPARSPFEAQVRLLSGVTAPTIFDLGAHHGQTAKRYATAFPGAKIHSFEPDEDSIRAYRAAVGDRAGTEVHRLAVTDRCGETTFHINHWTATSSLYPRPAESRRYFPEAATTARQVTVETTTLDAFCAAREISRLDILKMDIQGGELKALHGASELLKREAIDVIFTEAMFVPHYEGAPLYHELAGFLASHGYSLYDLFLAAHGSNGQLRYGDAIFVSSRIRSEVIDRLPAEP
jgi:FkbM family methyltransferase